MVATTFPQKGKMKVGVFSSPLNAQSFFIFLIQVATICRAINFFARFKAAIIYASPCLSSSLFV